MTTSILTNAPDLTGDDYCVLGLATCFYREEGEIHPVEIIEPIPSSALEALLKGIPTSYQKAIAISVDVLCPGDSPQPPSEFPAQSQFCDDFQERLIATVRTYKRRPEAQSHIPLGTVYEGFNYSTEKKRILDLENIVTAEDNVKQHSYTHQVL